MPKYHRYGGRGITICDEWKDSFIKFYEWVVTNGYKEGLQIDRIDNDGNYEPGNCRFVTARVNSHNSTSTKLSMEEADEIRMIYKRSSLYMREVGKLYNVTATTVCDIVNGRRWTHI
jgi:hypothetical protein